MEQDVPGGVIAVVLAWFLGGVATKFLEFGWSHYWGMPGTAIALSIVLFGLVYFLGFMPGWPLMFPATFLAVITGLRAVYFDPKAFFPEEPWYASSFYVFLVALALTGAWFAYYRWYKNTF